MTEKIELLRLILSMRLKYVNNWGNVAVRTEPYNEVFSITWSSFLGDPDNSAFFQSTTYPEKMIDKIIKEQKNKLKRDMPNNEKDILKSIL